VLPGTPPTQDSPTAADGYDYAVEFRHPSWGTEGPWEMLKHYNIAKALPAPILGIFRMLWPSVKYVSISSEILLLTVDVSFTFIY
jgi:hypothetical protein